MDTRQPSSRILSNALQFEWNQSMNEGMFPEADSMMRVSVIAVIIFASATLAVAQVAGLSTDVLGAHLNYGRGCAACHTPHSGSYGNGNGGTIGLGAGGALLWGEDVESLFGKTIVTGGGRFVEVLPTSLSATTPDVPGMLMCLSCHDGNFAQSAMMKNRVYEPLPATYGATNSIPTLIGRSGASSGDYLSEHPVGLSAKVGCGGSFDWDCSIDAIGEIRMTGPSSRRFVANYGFFVKPGSYGNSAVVVCTTYHDPHRMNVVTVSGGPASGLPAGTYATMFFLRAPYNPNDANPMSNQTAQFCRQCHADKSNEMNGSTAGTVF